MPPHTPLTVTEKTSICRWLGHHASFRLAYSAARDGCTPETFHQKCDNMAPTLTVAYSDNSYVYGGYATHAWNSLNGSYIDDHKAFLFRLRAPGNHDPIQMPSMGSNSQLLCHTSWGPYFKDSSSGGVVVFLGSSNTKHGDIINIKDERCEVDKMKSAFHIPDGMTPDTFSGGTNKVHDIEVYTITAVPRLDSPWRKFGSNNEWSEKVRGHLLQGVVSFAPLPQSGVTQARILLVGQVGAGKSSFINTVNSVFWGYKTSQAPAGSEAHSYTTKFRTYEVYHGRGGPALNFRLCDTMGLEDGDRDHGPEYTYIMDGNIQDFYQFNPAVAITPDHPDFVVTPKVKDKIHVVAAVIDAITWPVMSEPIKERLLALKRSAKDRGIPFAILLTKIDKLSPDLASDVNVAFHREEVRDMAKQVAETFGILPENVLPIRNYYIEDELETAIDILALLALRKLLRLGDGYLMEIIAQLGKSGTAAAARD